MKKKAFISALISSFVVLGFMFVLVFITIKDNFYNTPNYSVETITTSPAGNGTLKSSTTLKAKGSAVSTSNLNIPELSRDKKKASTQAVNNESGSKQVVLTPAPNYNVSKGNKNSTLVPNSTSGSASRRVSNGGNSSAMYSVAMPDNSTDNLKKTGTGFVSTTSDLTSPQMAGQKFNAGGSPPPSEKEPIDGSLPIGDGWNFLILLAVVYAGLKKWYI